MPAGALSVACTVSYNNILSGPASQALIDFEDRLPEPESLKRAMKGLSPFTIDGKPSFLQLGDKRRKRSIDMGDLLASIKPVEDSIAFPTIEWSFDDCDSEDEPRNGSRSCCILDTDKLADGDEVRSWKRPYASVSHFGKRSRHAGLVRSKRNTISLASGAPSASDRSLTSDSLPAFQTSSLSALVLNSGHNTADLVTIALAEAVKV